MQERLLNVATGSYLAIGTASAKVRERYKNGPDQLLDGNPETSWKAGDTGPQWVQVSWKFPRIANGVTLEMQAGNIHSFRISSKMGGSISNDWQHIAGGSVPKTVSTHRVLFDPVKVKAIRLDLVPTSADVAVELANLKVHSPESLAVHALDALAGRESDSSFRIKRIRAPGRLRHASWAQVAAEVECLRLPEYEPVFALLIGLPSLIPSEDLSLCESVIRWHSQSKPWEIGKTQELQFQVWIPEYAPPGVELKVSLMASDGKQKWILPGALAQPVQVGRTKKPGKLHNQTVLLKKIGQRSVIDIDGEILSGRHACLGTKTFENMYNLVQSGYRLFVIGSYPHYPIDAEGNEDANLDLCFRLIDRQCRLMQTYAPESRFIINLIYRSTPEFIRAHQAECVKLPDGHVSRPSGASEMFQETCRRITQKLVKRIREQPYSQRIVGYELNGFEDGTFRWWAYNHGKWGKRNEVLVPVDLSKPAEMSFLNWITRRYGSLQAAGKAWSAPNLTAENLPQTSIGSMLFDYGTAVRDPIRSRPASDYFDFRHETMLGLRTDLAELVRRVHRTPILMQTHSSFPAYGIFQPCPPLISNGNQHVLCSSSAYDSLGQNHSYNFRRRETHYASQTIYSSLQGHGKIAWSELDNRTWLSTLADYKEYSQRGTIEVERLNFGANLCLGMAERRLNFDSVKAEKGMALWNGDPELNRELRNYSAVEDFALQEPWYSDKEIAVFIGDRNQYFMDLLTPLPNFNQVYEVLQKELHFIGAAFDLYHLDDLRAASDREIYKLCIFLNAEALSDEQIVIINERFKRNGRTLLWFWAPGYINERTGMDAGRASSVTGMKLKVDLTPLMDEIRLDPSHRWFPEMDSQKIFSRLPYANRQWFQKTYAPHFHAEDNGIETAGRYAVNGKTAFAIKKAKDWTSVFCGIPYLPRQILSKVAEEAGVHRFVNDPRLYVNACRSWVVLHNTVAEPSETMVRLPRHARIYDLFRKKVLSRGANKFDTRLGPYETRLFYLGEQKVESLGAKFDWGE